MKNIYEQAVATLPADHIDHSSYGSDLYLKKSPEADKLIKAYDFHNRVTTFRSQIDGCIWYDIPFGYMPYWEEVARKSARIQEGQRK